MIASTLPFFFVLLLTSQYINAYPFGTKDNHPTNQQLNRNYGFLQHHDLPYYLNDEIPTNIDENLSYNYPIIQRQNRKRLIDF